MKLTAFIILCAVGCITLNCDTTHVDIVDKKTVFVDKYTIPDTLTADGESTISINVQLPNDASEDRRTVNFKASKGTFIESTTNTAVAKARFIEFNSGKKLIATVTLQATTKPSQEYVAIEAFDVKDTIPISFKKAYPDDMVINVDKFYVNPGLDSELNISIQLKRKIGIPSIGNAVSLTITDTDNNIRGMFRNNQPESNDKGTASFIYSLGNDTYTGKLIVRAKSTNSRGEAIIKTIDIFSKSK